MSLINKIGAFLLHSLKLKDKISLKKLFLFIIFFIPLILTAQEFNYVHYDTKDGLAGSTVYSMCQDKDGFMWFATENGLSRYDGTHFKNFTVKDGLPDNEVLKVFADSKGRVWIGTFSKEICFYYKGKIHTMRNNSLVRQIVSDRNIEAIVEDEGGFIGLSFRSIILIITPKDSVIQYDINDICPKSNIGGRIFNYSGKIKLSVTDDIRSYEYSFTNLDWEKSYEYKRKLNLPHFNNDSSSIPVLFDTTKKVFIEIAFPGKFFSIESRGNSAKFISTTNGVWSFDAQNIKLGLHYLAGKKISQTVEDNEKNIWFSSLGEGVFKLPSQVVKTFIFSTHTQSNLQSNTNEVFSIITHEKGVIAGVESNRVQFIDKNFTIQELQYNINEILVGIVESTNRLYSMLNISNSKVILGFDKFLVKVENSKSKVNYINPIKSVEKINNDFIIVGTSAYAFKMSLKDLQITDTIWRERCTKVFYQNNNYYIGTLTGLYEVREDKTYTYLGDLHPALSRRITDIKSAADGTLWISTSDNGIVAYKNGKIIKIITDNNGLSSNICKTIFIEGNALWVGTDKGINKINTTNGQYNIIKYSTSDGLPSNTINALYVKDTIIWVGSPAGLTYFKENSISNSSICNLQMLGIYVSGKQLVSDSSFKLSYKNNNVNFEYAGISFRSGGEIGYHYKLTGLDNEWKTTTENNLDYKSLPADDYKLELYAVNKYDIKSNTITINFLVQAPFWKTIWFYVLMAAVIITAITILFNWRNKKTKHRLEEKNNFQKQFAVLEQQALQSQMNPHFIFNCLNSIQQYILTNDKEKANQYLTDFAALIRQTLDISSQKTITVAEEASYLKKYLDMERMRFGDTFNYSIYVAGEVKADYVQIPALLLQPYVENSLRHGIRYKTEGGGKIEISFSLKQDNLHCIIKDNGVGRDKAAEFKSRQHIEYQSKGMSLTGKRIELLNTINERKIIVTVTDLLKENNAAAGTLVEINIPV